MGIRLAHPHHGGGGGVRAPGGLGLGGDGHDGRDGGGDGEHGHEVRLGSEGPLEIWAEWGTAAPILSPKRQSPRQKGTVPGRFLWNLILDFAQTPARDEDVVAACGRPGPESDGTQKWARSEFLNFYGRKRASQSPRPVHPASSMRVHACARLLRRAQGAAQWLTGLINNANMQPACAVSAHGKGVRPRPCVLLAGVVLHELAARVGFACLAVEQLRRHGQVVALGHEVVQARTPLQHGLDRLVQDDLRVRRGHGEVRTDTTACRHPPRQPTASQKPLIYPHTD